MKTPQYLVKAPIDSPNRSGFSMPFENHLTGECGTLYPALMKEMIPNETVSLDVLHDIELPPMVSNFRGRVDMIYEAFFVPYSLLWGGWEQFAMHPTHNPIYPENTPVDWKPTSIPRLVFSSSDTTLIGTSSLANYLGFRGAPVLGVGYGCNILPFLCYHRIYDDWYRNSMVQTKVFGKPRYQFKSGDDYSVSHFPDITFVDPSIGNSSIDNTISVHADTSAASFFDGVNILELRQRNWNLDYFTSATPQPQAGNSTSIEFAVDADGNGSFSIAALRSGNAIQQWKERNNIVGYDYYSQMHAQHGIFPRMRKLDKCIYLGRVVDPVYNRSVFQTAATDATGSPNPFADLSGAGVGTKFGSSQANGRGNLFSNFTTFDYGYIVVMVSMRPHAYYSSGIDPKLKTQFIGDIAFPLLSGVGDQPIYADELNAGSSNVFGWTDRYAQHKCYVDEIHGDFSADGILAPFVLQRNIGSNPVIGSDFLEIPKNFMEQVRQVDKSIVTEDWFGTIYFNFNKISTLPQYSVPTLANIKHSHTEFVRKGGQKL